MSQYVLSAHVKPANRQSTILWPDTALNVPKTNSAPAQTLLGTATEKAGPGSRIPKADAGSPSYLLPGSGGAHPTLVALKDRLALLLWRDAKTPVALRLLTVRSGRVMAGPERSLGFTALAPVGAAAGARTRGAEAVWVAVTQDQDAARPSRWQVRRLDIRGDEVREAGSEWVGGEKRQERGSSRVTLLWEPDRTVGPEGRLYFLCTGTLSAQAPWQCHYVSMRIGDRGVNGGWLTRRYYDEWTQSRSTPGACWFRGDFVFAARWFGNVHGTENDNLFVAFHGRGIASAPVGDFDDVGFIRDVGLRHSIPWVTAP